MKTKTINNYAQCMSQEFYTVCPKAVFAALAVSFGAIHNETEPDDAEAFLLREWKILHENGIVPQAPPKSFRGKPFEASKARSLGAIKEPEK